MTEYARPVLCQWDSIAFVPCGPFHARVATEDYQPGARYVLCEHQERSEKSHRAFFAFVNECWQSLPEDLAGQYPSAEHLRKRALIETGFHDCLSHVCPSKAEAIRLRAFIQPLDEFSVVIAKDCVVTVYRAKSQSQKAMGKVEFARSQDAVRGWLRDLLHLDMPPENDRQRP